MIKETEDARWSKGLLIGVRETAMLANATKLKARPEDNAAKK